ncbi:hypothetical protein MPH_10225 [Macrophomina phaseolina MS6]|uniref:Uncharacterized protein n=1 Tax=Macrophomina phaseolina (strain MS6) TaxID=1126212 RepID=K2QRY8_MACPH|nr:hypothetical protein MPH_10225 [Macrophomina phaseolina MS6]
MSSQTVSASTQRAPHAHYKISDLGWGVSEARLIPKYTSKEESNPNISEIAGTNIAACPLSVSPQIRGHFTFTPCRSSIVDQSSTRLAALPALSPSAQQSSRGQGQRIHQENSRGAWGQTWPPQSASQASPAASRAPSPPPSSGGSPPTPAASTSAASRATPPTCPPRCSTPRTSPSSPAPRPPTPPPCAPSCAAATSSSAATRSPRPRSSRRSWSAGSSCWPTCAPRKACGASCRATSRTTTRGWSTGSCWSRSRRSGSRSTWTRRKESRGCM